MYTNQLCTISRGSIFKRIRQNLQFLIRNFYNAITVCFGVPVTVLVLDASTLPMPIVRKASVHGARMEQIAERSEAR